MELVACTTFLLFKRFQNLNFDMTPENFESSRFDNPSFFIQFLKRFKNIFIAHYRLYFGRYLLPLLFKAKITFKVL